MTLCKIQNDFESEVLLFFRFLIEAVFIDLHANDFQGIGGKTRGKDRGKGGKEG